jgi:small ligand-binding sensory domain FIST
MASTTICSRKNAMPKFLNSGRNKNNGVSSDFGASMTARAQPHFIAVAGKDNDWRALMANLLAEFVAQPEAHDCTMGFIYVSDYHAQHMQQIIELLRDVTAIPHWVGSVGVGIMGPDRNYFDEPAISFMAAEIDPDLFCTVPVYDMNNKAPDRELKKWLHHHEPMLVLLHGDASASSDPVTALKILSAEIGGYTVGGLSTGRHHTYQLADEISEGALCGVAFDSEVPVAVAMAQGCNPLGPVHKVTKMLEGRIHELDGRRAYDVFIEDLKKYTGPMSSDIKTIFDVPGEIHLAIPVPDRDQHDFLVRHAKAINREGGWIDVTWPLAQGDELMFVHRDDKTVREDFIRQCYYLRNRVESERGYFAPRGALFISCMARSASLGNGVGWEREIMEDLLGAMPLVGFYASGEIVNSYIYGYTGLIILFL